MKNKLEISVIPRPGKINISAGEFFLLENTAIVSKPELSGLSSQIKDLIDPFTGGKNIHRICFTERNILWNSNLETASSSERPEKQAGGNRLREN